MSWQSALAGSDSKTFEQGVLTPAKDLVDTPTDSSRNFADGAKWLSDKFGLSIMAAKTIGAKLLLQSEQAQRVALLVPGGMLSKWYTRHLVTSVVFKRTFDRPPRPEQSIAAFSDCWAKALSGIKNSKGGLAWSPNVFSAVEFEETQFLALAHVKSATEPTADVKMQFKTTAQVLQTAVENHPEFARVLRALFPREEFNPLAPITEYVLMRAVNGGNTERNLKYLEHLATRWAMLENHVLGEKADVVSLTTHMKELVQRVFKEELLPMAKVLHTIGDVVALLSWPVAGRKAINFAPVAVDQKADTTSREAVAAHFLPAYVFSRMADIWYDPSRLPTANFDSLSAVNNGNLNGLKDPAGRSVHAALVWALNPANAVKLGVKLKNEIRPALVVRGDAGMPALPAPEVKGGGGLPAAHVHPALPAPEAKRAGGVHPALFADSDGDNDGENAELDLDDQVDGLGLRGFGR